MIDGNTQLIGLIGYPVAHSFSPIMHNAAAAALGLNFAYVPRRSGRTNCPTRCAVWWRSVFGAST